MDDQNNPIETLIKKLQSPKQNDRYMACEELRKATDITPEAVKALEIALHDPDEDVRGAAKRALNTTPFNFSRTVDKPKITPPFSEAYAYNTPQREATASYISSSSQMPGGSPNTVEYINGLEKRIMTLEVELSRISREIPEINSRSKDVIIKIPDSNMFSNDYLKRAFAVWGHYFVAQLLISIPIFLFFYFIAWIITSSLQ